MPGRTGAQYRLALGLAAALLTAALPLAHAQFADDRSEFVGLLKLWAFTAYVSLIGGNVTLSDNNVTLRGGIPLIEYLEHGHYVGIDVRAEALEEGRVELREHGLEDKAPTLIAFDDFAGLALEREFDVVWAFAVLFHLSDEILDACLAFVASHLKPDGVFYANVRLGQDREGAWQGFPVVTRSQEHYVEAAARAGLTVERVGTLGDLGHRSGARAADNQVMLRFSPVA